MRLGKIEIEKPLALAPMEDVTDLSFRLICKQLGADLLYTEFVNAEGLSRYSAKTFGKMRFLEEERPFGIQIYGGDESSMERAAEMAEAEQPDIIDINAGCWVRDVALRGAGAGLLKDLPRMERLARIVVNSVKLPVTLKTRLGWDQNSIKIVEVAKMLEQAGVQALTIHCRTREQGHRGEADFNWIPRIKSAVSIPVIANGSLDTPEKIKNVFEETGCDGVMIGRGAIANPWIFNEAKEFMKTGSLLPQPTLEQRAELLFKHLKLSVEFKGERRGVIEFRKFYSGYLKGIRNAAKLRHELMQFTEMNPVIELITRFVESYEPITV